MAETNGLLNRRTGKSGTEGSNPSVSATRPIISKAYMENVSLPTFIPTFSRELVTDCLAPNKYPPTPFKIPTQRDPTGVVPPLFWLMGPTVPSYILFCAFG